MYLFWTLISLSFFAFIESHGYYDNQHTNGQTFSNDGSAYRPIYQLSRPVYNKVVVSKYPIYTPIRRITIRKSNHKFDNLEVDNDQNDQGNNDNNNDNSNSDHSSITYKIVSPTNPTPQQTTETSDSDEKVMNKPLKAVAVLRGVAKGILYFEQKGDKVHITGSIDGLTNGLHAFHVHDFGDLTRSCDSSGDHYNPYKTKHGSPFDSVRHVGDLGNVFADESGIAKIDIQDKFLNLREGKNNILGHAIIVHEGVDDLGRGGHVKSGRRTGCGIIGWRNDLE